MGAPSEVAGNPLEVLANRRVLLLQGPAGPFFRRVADHLRRRGATVSKVNFNAGDDLFYSGPDVVAFRGTRAEWAQFFTQLVRQLRIEAVVLFGDCRPLHRVAVKRAAELGVAVYVFEEGYLRPDFVTFEPGGVNGYSSIPRDPETFRALEPRELPPPRPIGNVMPRAAGYATAYAVWNGLFRNRYPHYKHHRDIRPFHQAGCWIRGASRRLANTLRDREIDARLGAGTLPPFFLVPLQVHLDAQFRHGPFDGAESFIDHVVRSFAARAPSDVMLLVKHHPMDRPYRDYQPLFDQLRNELGLGDRLVYCDVIHLPTALRSARGTVVLNSTSGLSSIHHGTPVKCLGRAVYDIPGLTFQGSLEEFWLDPGRVDEALYRRFRYWLRTHNQINGSVWSDLWPSTEQHKRA